ncbi:geraniol 8-hydroxylase-like, partial [Gastrolobium bilobum]|uniref:geraniol 8-hydroxylase-like n=1 Tax=Gastrolobium bilobum TaxID=150636 RepID=UPI002AB05692
LKYFYQTIPDAVSAVNHKEYSMTFMPISPRWRALRKICNGQLFANKTLDASIDLRRKKVQELLADIHQNSLKCEAVEIGSVAFKTAINLLSNTIFSLDLFHSTGSAGEFKELVTKIMKEVGTPNLADYFPILKMVDPQGVRRRTGSYVIKIIDIFRCLINQRLNLREGKSNTMNYMLDTLLNISQENSHEMDNLQIEHLFLTLFVAGTDTITTTLEWAMAEVIRNSEVMLKAKQELEETIGIGNPVDETDIAKLPYLKAIIKETFRLHPPVPFLIPRKAKTNIEICGYTVPKDAQVLVNVWAIGRDSSAWDNPNLFLPERFLGSEIDVKGHDFELAPFGAGRRICPGLPLAMRTLLLMLGSLVNSFNWKLEDHMKLEDINMDDKFGITIEKAQPLRVVPVKVNN